MRDAHTTLDEGSADGERLSEESRQPMAEENIIVVRRFIRRFVAQDIDATLGDVHAEAELDWSNSEAPDRVVYTAHAGWRAFANARDESLAGRGFEFVELMAPTPDTVVVVGRTHEHGRASGVAVEAQGAAVFTLRQGKSLA
jgi:ketosteroid isomerase-like protein